jgi:hypothetical protein
MRFALKSVTCVLLMVFGLAAAQDTPFDQPIQEAVTDPQEVLATVEAAQENIFYVAPSLTSESLAQIMAARAQAGVSVYVVVNADKTNALLGGLAGAGAQVRVLGNFVEGMLLVDYDVLIAGGLISGSSRETLRVETRAFGTTVTDQLRALWQAAEPYGG